MRNFKATILFLLALLVAAPFATAQVVTSTAVPPISLTMTVPQSLTITATPSSITFNGSGVANGPITVTTAWNFSAAGKKLWTEAYFSSATAALTAGANANIPSSAVQSQIGTGALAPCTQTDANVAAATPGATCSNIFSSTNGSLTASGNNTANLTLSIPTANTFTPGNYTGTLNISASSN